MSVSDYLRPLSPTFSNKQIWVWDVESKNDDTQDKGWTRPFLLGFYDGIKYRAFRNDSSLARFDWKFRHVQRGGLTDKFMRFALGMLPGSSPERFQAKRGAFYAHNGGRFDDLFILNWLIQQKDFAFEIASVQSRIQRLDVWRRGTNKEDGYWSFLDSVSLLPMSLKRVGETFAPKTAGKMTMDLDAPEDAHAATVVDPSRIVDHVWGYTRDGKKLSPKEKPIAGDIAIFYKVLKQAPAGCKDVFSLWERYNRIDCEVLREGLLGFSTMVNRLGTDIGITTPSTSMKLFRRAFQSERWLPRNAHFSHCDQTCRRAPCERLSCDGTCHGCLHDFIREGFYGGRTEKFEDTGYLLHYFDINSSYAAAMQFGMPVGKAIEREPITLKEILRLSKNHVGFVECEVEIPSSCRIPPLPYRSKGGEAMVTHPDGKKRPLSPGKLIFPAGRFSGVWNVAELLLLFHPLVKGNILRVGKSVWYAKKPIFRKMVQSLYSLRKKHLQTCEDKGCEGCNPDFSIGMSEVAKLLANAFFGKTGMREERTSLVYLPPGEDWRGLSHAWPTNGDPQNCNVWEVERIAEAPYVMPQYAATITAYARRRLFLAICDILTRGGHVMYCDTDSIISSIKLSDYMIDPQVLGKWKQEDPNMKLAGRFILPKLYQLEAHLPSCFDLSCEGCGHFEKVHLPSCKNPKCKGCSPHKQRMKGVGGAQTKEVFDALVSRDLSRAPRFERVVAHKTMLKKSIGRVTAFKDDRDRGGEDKRAVKSLRSYYDKRQSLSDGTSRPLVLGEDS